MTPAERLLQAFARLVLKIFFRRVEVVGEERIPLDRPMVLVANHVNGLVDAALLVGTLPVWPRMLAKSTLWICLPTKAQPRPSDIHCFESRLPGRVKASEDSCKDPRCDKLPALDDRTVNTDVLIRRHNGVLTEQFSPPRVSLDQRLEL